MPAESEKQQSFVANYIKRGVLLQLRQLKFLEVQMATNSIRLDQNLIEKATIMAKALMADPNIGEQKKGDLAFLRVHKFKMNKQLTLLGYSFDDGALVLELMAFGLTRKLLSRYQAEEMTL